MSTKVKPQEQEEEAHNPGEAVKQIAAKAQSEIAELRKRIESFQASSQELYTERQELLTEQAQRRDHLANLRHTVAGLVAKHQDATAYASVAIGTLGEHEAVKDVSKIENELTPLRATLEKTEADYNELNAAAVIRLAEIDALIEHATIESDQAAGRLHEVQKVSTRAVAELGEHTYEKLLQEYQQHTEGIDQLKRAVVDLEVKRQQFLDYACETLVSWPGQQQKMRGQQPAQNHDATSRVISAAISYLETLIKDGANLARFDTGPVTYSYQDWRQLLVVSAGELFIYEDLSGPKVMLRDHLYRLQQTHSGYLKLKQ